MVLYDRNAVDTQAHRWVSSYTLTRCFVANPDWRKPVRFGMMVAIQADYVCAKGDRVARSGGAIGPVDTMPLAQGANPLARLALTGNRIAPWEG